MSHSIRFASLICSFCIILFATSSSRLTAQGIGIRNGFPFTADPLDTTTSDYLPIAFSGPAGSHGFVKSDAKGNLQFDDGTPVRFVGVVMSGSACFPDSLGAIAEARRLRKLGVNLVRFRYMDFSYDWAATVSILDPMTGFRTIQPDQARKFDWLVYQLKQNGIYTGLTLLSARAPRPEDGLSAEALDSIPWIAQGVHYLYPQTRAAHKTVARALLDHVNSFTGLPYKNEPAIASLEILCRQSAEMFNRISYDFPGGLYNWRMSRRMDTLYNTWLRDKYGSTSALAAAWNVVPPAGGYPNIIKEGSFEGAFDAQWTFASGNGVTATPILSGDNAPDGQYALQMRLRNTTGDVYSAYMWQPVSIDFNKMYQLTFKVKGSNPEGRSLAVGIFPGTDGLFSGVLQAAAVSSEWKEDTISFLVPVSNNSPQYLYIWYGDKDGELSIDDIRLRELAPVGLVPDENLENVLVRRNGWGQNLTLSPRRFIDQADFYASLDKDYFGDLHRFVRDTVGAKQMISGSELIWASTILDAAAQKEFDMSLSAQGWDWVGDMNGTWGIQNYSPLRATYAGATYIYGSTAQQGQAYLPSFTTPFPNRYQAESMLQVPAYALLQDWDGFVWDNYDEDLGDNRRDIVDSADWYSMRNNPVVSALMPSISQMVRNGLVAPARTTIRLQHTHDQLYSLPRLEAAWGTYGVPGALNAFGAAISRIVLDSTNASEFTQTNDFAFEGQVEGEVTSDTRQIHWEYARSLLTIDAPSVQGITGLLNRAGGISTSKMDINAFTLNETSTLLWVPLDATKTLDQPGRSLLTVITRSEPTGWLWADSTTASRWGEGPMLMEPARIQIDFKPGKNIVAVKVQPLDQRGIPVGSPLEVTKAGNDFRITIDQSQTHNVWYSVEMIQGELGVQGDEVAGSDVSLRALPNVVTDQGTIYINLPSGESDVQVELFDQLGRSVRTLHTGPMEAGEGRLDFDPSDLPTGSYFVKAKIGSNRTAVDEIRIVR